MPKFSMPIIRPLPSDAGGISNYATTNTPGRVSIAYPIRTVNSDQTNSRDGLEIVIRGVAADAAERNVYAMLQGTVVFGYQDLSDSSRSKVRAILELSDASRHAYGGNRGGSGGIDMRFRCFAKLEYQNLDLDSVRSALYPLLVQAYTSAGARRPPPELRWLLDTQVLVEEEDSEGDRRRRRTLSLAQWFQEHNVDEYLGIILGDEYLQRFALGAPPVEAFGLRIETGTLIGKIASESSESYRLFLKCWSEHRNVLNPGLLFNLVAVDATARIPKIDFLGEFQGDVSTENKLGIQEILDLNIEPNTGSGALQGYPPEALRGTVHPLIWAIGRDTEEIFEYDSRTRRLQLIERPPRYVPTRTSLTLAELFERYSSVRFTTAADIDNFFRTSTEATFIEWFNARLASHWPWLRPKPKYACCFGNAGPISIGRSGRRRSSLGPIQLNFVKLWDHIPTIYRESGINLLQFVTLLTMIIREVGTFTPIDEGGNLAYMFQYNRGGNRRAYDLFRDPLYILTHGRDAPTNEITRRLFMTEDVAWQGLDYPSGFPTGRDDQAAQFIMQADFFKFRGRGFIQTTFRNAYKPLAEIVLRYNGENSDISAVQQQWISRIEVARVNRIPVDDLVEGALTVSTNHEWNQLFASSDFWFAARGLELFFFEFKNQPLTYRSIDNPLSYVRRVTGAVGAGGGGCSIEMNVLRVLSVLQACSESE